MEVKYFLFLLFAVAVLYMLLIFAFTEGWNRLDNKPFSHRNLSTRLSVVIPFRNEGENLVRLLQALLLQSYPPELCEFVFVNDHSDDKGQELLENFVSEQKLQNVRMLHSVRRGKKAALRTGIQAAKGELVITTDADCFPLRSWLTETVAFYEEKHPRLILGPVIYYGEKTLLQKLFSLDFMSLVVSGAGSAGLGLPFMGNAANMAFEKQVYLDADTDALQSGFASGDDVFFIQYIRRKYGRKAITFIKNEEVIIRTPPPENLKTFLSQRIRWGSKARAYTQPWAMFVSYLIFLFNFLLVVALAAGFFVPWFLVIWALFIVMKTIVDFPILYAFARFSGKRRLLPYVFPFETVYPLYITFVAFRGLFPYRWKDRNWKR